LRHDRRFRQVILAALAVGLVYVQAFSTMSLAITDSGFSPATYGKVIALNGLLVVVFELLLTTFTKHHAPRRMMALGFVLVGAGFATNLIPRTLPLMLGTVTLFTFGEMIAMPVAGAYVADLAPPHKRGLYMGAYMMVWAIAMVVGPSLGMQLYAYSPRVLWSACGAMGLFASVLILFEPARRPPLPEPRFTVLGASSEP
jgi:MFS family permease